MVDFKISHPKDAFANAAQWQPNAKISLTDDFQTSVQLQVAPPDAIPDYNAQGPQQQIEHKGVREISTTNPSLCHQVDVAGFSVQAAGTGSLLTDCISACAQLGQDMQLGLQPPEPQPQQPDMVAGRAPVNPETEIQQVWTPPTTSLTMKPAGMMG